MTYSNVVVGCLAICAVFGALVFEALFGTMGFHAVARTIVVGWIELSVALWIVSLLWLWRTHVRRELLVEFPRARARRAR